MRKAHDNGALHHHTGVKPHGLRPPVLLGAPMQNDQRSPVSAAATTQADEDDQDEFDVASIIHQMLRDQFREYHVEARQVRPRARALGRQPLASRWSER